MRRRYLLTVAVLAVIALVFLLAVPARSEWIMCSDYVNVREKPMKKGAVAGFLDTGDEIRTDGEKRNGFLRVLGVGESGEGWVFAGFISDEKPEKVNARYVCVAVNRVACRRWIGGPRIKGKTGWLYNGSTVTVYYRTDEWSVTSRGYIRSEWLEPDPE